MRSSQPTSATEPIPCPVVACLFDAYGTLFDVAAAARHLADDIGPDWSQLAKTWRLRQTEYAWLRTLTGQYVDFQTVTAEALDYAFASLGRIPTPGLPDRLMDLYMTLDPHPEVIHALTALRHKGVATAILSNGSPTMLEAAVSSAGLGSLLDDVLSVDTIRRYKPAPEAYALGCRRFATEPARLAFVSSNGWDIAGASAFGFYSIWVNRDNAPVERMPSSPVVEVESLTSLPLYIGPVQEVSDAQTQQPV